jgi:hypothetical protein
MADDHEHLFPPEPEPRRRTPAGKALAVVLVALLVGALFNADSLHQTAASEPIGSWQRTWAMQVTGPLKSISDATLLNRPRKWLADTSGHGGEPAPLSTKTVVTAPPAPASTTTTAPPPARTPTAADPVRLLVAGDSLMGWIGPSLAKAFDGKPVEVNEDWKAATGLSRPDYVNWPARLKEGLEQYDPEVLVIGFGGNDSQGMTTADGKVAAQHTPEWRAEYQRRVAQILDIAAKKGRTVYWLGVPLTTSANIEKTWPDMTEGIEAEVAARPWAHFVDTRTTLTPNGRYTAYLPDASGQQVKVRENDGVHPTPRGAEFEVAPLVEDLRKERKLR